MAQATDSLSVVGWVSIFAGGVVIRFATRGRGLNNIPGDLSDLAIAAVSGGDVANILSRTGDATGSGTTAAIQTNTASRSAILAAAEKRGNAAKGYQLGATGPDYYDCSGLVWRALQDNGYAGARFTTYTLPGLSGFTVVTSPQVGDIVNWGRNGVNGHMGIMVDGSNFYSALSPTSGIKTLPVATITKQKGYAPTYYRWNA